MTSSGAPSALGVGCACSSSSSSSSSLLIICVFYTLITPSQFSYILDLVDVGLEPVLDTDLHTGCGLLESLEEALVGGGVSIHDRVLQVLNQWVLVALLDQPLYHLVRVKQVLRALNIILQLILQIHALTVWVHSVFQVLLFVSLKREMKSER